MITLSIVSHRHGAEVAALLTDIARSALECKIIITVNVPDADIAVPASLTDHIQWRVNQHPRGFAANHNAAFKFCDTSLFAVLNPDLRWTVNPFPLLLPLFSDPQVGLVAPAVWGSEGQLEDSIRYFPTLIGLISKLFGKSDGRYRFSLQDKPFPADWVAGMFMLFRSSAFAATGGFDEGFFLYYEDVDICARFWRAGHKVLACPAVHVTHDARRASHREPQHFRWHASSMARYFAKHGLRQPGKSRVRS